MEISIVLFGGRRKSYEEQRMSIINTWFEERLSPAQKE
jgi:hypothetical protein